MSRLMSLTKPRDTRPNLEHQCESLAITNRTTEQATRPLTRRRMCGACVASVPASVRCACLGVGCLSASRVCPALGVCSLSCLLVYLPVRCQATQACSTMFTLGYSCCCAARAVCSCAFGCSPRFLSTLTTDTAGQHGRHRHPDTHTPIHPRAHTRRRHLETHTNTDTHTHTPTDPHTNIHSHMHHFLKTYFVCVFLVYYYFYFLHGPFFKKFLKISKSKPRKTPGGFF